MIIQIRGTSGSGKTWVMREVMNRLNYLKPVYVPTWAGKKRRQPLYYYSGTDRVAVLGHYESTCGGCDNVGSARHVFELIEKVRESEEAVGGDCSIVCEGLLLSEDSKWSSQLVDLHAFFLATPVEKCLEQIRMRRLEAGNSKPLKEDNTRNRVAVIERARIKLIDSGAVCRRVSAKQAPREVLKLLGYTRAKGS